MALSRQVIVSDGTTKQYPISFADGYVSRDEVKVYEEFLDDTPDAEIPFTFINDYLIELSRVPVSGNKIVIERDVEASARKVIFLPEYIKSNDLNTMYKHLLYLAQAVLDGRWEGSIGVDLDMAGHRIINVGAPKDDNDAVRLVDIKTYTDLAQSLNTQNTASAAAAKVSETNAKASELAAKASADFASNTVNGFDTRADERQAQFDTNAAEKQAAVDASAETARKWAVGTLQEQPAGSSKYWAEYAKSVTDGALNETMITNCITTIPQDIKLELNNGTLTLKAGSKVYVPNGVGVFDEVIIQSDLTLTFTKPSSTKEIILLRYDQSQLEHWDTNDCYSGSSKPSAQYQCWYNTDANTINASSNGGSSYGVNLSLPLVQISVDSTGITSIDKIFNGFPYIGSTIFALPGVEGLIPNGRNADGSLNNIKFKTTSVLTYNNFAGAYTRYIYLGADTVVGNVNTYTYIQDIEPTNIQTGNVYWINEKDNFIKYTNNQGALWSNVSYALVGDYITDSTGRITSFSPKNTFQAVDRNELQPDTLKRIAYEGNRDINCSGAVTVVLKDTDESINLIISDNTTITYDCSQLSYSKGWATFQIHYGFSNGAKTVSHTNPLIYINGNIPDFSDGKWHWVVIRNSKAEADANNTLIMSDAGSEG